MESVSIFAIWLFDLMYVFALCVCFLFLLRRHRLRLWLLHITTAIYSRIIFIAVIGLKLFFIIWFFFSSIHWIWKEYYSLLLYTKDLDW